MNGVDWTEPETARLAVSSGIRFSIWFDGTYLHYAYASWTTNTPLYYRRGLPNNNGTITWSGAEETAVASALGIQYLYPVVSVDSEGYPWIGYILNPPGYPYAIRSNINDGTWDGFEVPDQLSTVSDALVASVSPLTGREMLAIYVYKGPEQVRARLWNNIVWGSEISTSTAAIFYPRFSAVAEGDDVHLVFKNPSKNIIYAKYDYSSNSFIAEKILIEYCASFPVISITDDNNLYVFLVGSSLTTIYYMIYTAENDTWGPVVKWESEDNLFAIAPTCFYKQYSGYTGLAYRTGSYPGPYAVIFNYIAPPPPPGVIPEPEEPGSPGAPEPTPEPKVEANTLTASGLRHTTPEQGSVGKRQSFKNTRISRHITWVPVVITRA